jgi:hypothetical protein
MIRKPPLSLAIASRLRPGLQCLTMRAKYQLMKQPLMSQ